MFVARRDLRFARGRFALMGAVVVLITTLIVLLSGLTAGLAHQSVSAIQDLPGTHVAFGGTKSFTESTITEEQVRAWRAQPGVTSASPLGIAQARATAGRTTVSVTVFGTDRADTALSESAAHDLRVGPGGQVSLDGRPTAVLKIVPDEWYSHTPVIWVPMATWRAISHTGEAATVIVLRTHGGTKAGDAAAHTQTVSRAAAATKVGSYSAENGSLTLMRGFLFAISALVIGAFFTVWTIQRQGDIAILRALGASGGYLVRDALAQALIVLTAGAGLGGGIGAGLGVLATATVPFTLTAATTVLPVALMIVLGMLGALLAVRRVTTVDPLTALGAVR